MTLDLPPAYRLATIGEADALAAAKRLARAGAEDGTLVFADARPDLNAALLGHPDLPPEEAVQLGLIAGLAMVDALGAVLPPASEVRLNWPGAIELNRGAVGRVRLALAPRADRPWCVLGFDLRHRNPLGRARKAHTSLDDKGVAMTPAEFLAVLARHLLSWVHRWHEDGFEPIRSAWMRHGFHRGDPAQLDEGGALSLAGRRKQTLLAAFAP